MIDFTQERCSIRASPSRTAVLIVGGGLVGLSAGLFLQRLGVPFILVEKQQGVSPLPLSLIHI